MTDSADAVSSTFGTGFAYPIYGAGRHAAGHGLQDTAALNPTALWVGKKADAGAPAIPFACTFSLRGAVSLSSLLAVGAVNMVVGLTPEVKWQSGGRRFSVWLGKNAIISVWPPSAPRRARSSTQLR